MGYITKTEFARKHNFSKQYVSELLRKGVLQEEEGGLLDEKNSDYALSLKQATKVSGGKNELQSLFFKAKLQNELEKGRILKLERKEKERLLIPVEKVRETIFTQGRVIRDAMLNIPDRVSSMVATMSDPKEIHAFLTKEIRTAIEGLIKKLRND